MKYDTSEIKRRLRGLKQFEIKVRFDGIAQTSNMLVWNQFFDINEPFGGKAKYSLYYLTLIRREDFRKIIEEYLASVYYELYKTSGKAYLEGQYDPQILARLDLPPTTTEPEIKQRFRELAKQYHPDKGGEAEQFIALMTDYKQLMED